MFVVCAIFIALVDYKMSTISSSKRDLSLTELETPAEGNISSEAELVFDYCHGSALTSLQVSAPGHAWKFSVFTYHRDP